MEESKAEEWRQQKEQHRAGWSGRDGGQEVVWMRKASGKWPKLVSPSQCCAWAYNTWQRVRNVWQLTAIVVLVHDCTCLEIWVDGIWHRKRSIPQLTAIGICARRPQNMRFGNSSRRSPSRLNTHGDTISSDALRHTLAGAMAEMCRP